MKKSSINNRLTMNRQSKIIVAVSLIFVISLIFIIASCSNNDTASGKDDSSLVVLARVEVADYIQDLELPVYAAQEDGDDVYYALVIATVQELNDAGVEYRVIDYYKPGTEYILASSESDEEHIEAAKKVKVLYDDGLSVIVRYKQDVDETLAELGFQLKFMSDTPIDLSLIDVTDFEETTASAGLAKNPDIEEMIGKITKEDVKDFISALSGETEVTVGGEPYRFLTRDTESGEPVEKATQYIYEQLNGLGRLKASYHNWKMAVTDEETEEDITYTGRNVVVDLPGNENPNEMIILIAHLDSIHDDGNELAPGADDNASGCAALFTIAKVMSNKEFKRSIRFVFTTGEEQGTCGSMTYVKVVKKEMQAGKKVIGVINLDMIAYHKKAGTKQRVKTRNAKDKNRAADARIANLYNSVVEIYDLDGKITPVISPDNELNSDHAAFWENKCAAIWVIEDDYDDFNENNMHSETDKVDTLNLPYCTGMIQATLGTAAHMAEKDTL